MANRQAEGAYSRDSRGVPRSSRETYSKGREMIDDQAAVETIEQQEYELFIYSRIGIIARWLIKRHKEISIETLTEAYEALSNDRND